MTDLEVRVFTTDRTPLGYELHMVKVVIAGVVFETNVPTRGDALRVAAQVARALGVGK